MRLPVVTDQFHHLMDQGRIIVYPIEQVVIPNKLEQVHGQAAIEVSQPGVVTRIHIEGIVAADTNRQDIAKDTFKKSFRRWLSTRSTLRVRKCIFL